MDGDTYRIKMEVAKKRDRNKSIKKGKEEGQELLPVYKQGEERG